MEIKLENPFIVQNEISVSIVKIHQVIDDQPAKQVVSTLDCGEFNGETIYKRIMVWDENEYDDAGQWTDEDLVNKIQKILNS